MNRSIIHLNIADFAVAVETSVTPALKGYPLIIAPSGSSRAVVYDMSDEAFRQGVRKGMPLARARQLNTQIKILPPRFNQYERVMKDLLKQAVAFTPLIESGTLDGHIFMDVTGASRLFGPSMDVAFKLKKAFKKTFRLDPIWSVASNKLIAKVATRMVKPAGEYMVAPGDEKDFLAPLPLNLIPGIETAELNRFRELNLLFVSQARALTLGQLQVPFNNRAEKIYDWIRGVDPTPVAPGQAHSSLAADHEFAGDTNARDLLKKAVYLLAGKICTTLRTRKQVCNAAKIILSYSDGRQKAARIPITPATSNEMILFKRCNLLLDTARTRRVRIRHLRLVCETLCLHHVQAQLFADKTTEARPASLVRAMDQIRERFGSHSIAPALTLIREENFQ